MTLDLIAVLILTGYMVGAATALTSIQLSSSQPAKYNKIWVSYWYEVGVFVVMLIPAYLHSGLFALLVIAIALMTQREIFDAVPNPPARRLRVAGATAVAGLLGGVWAFGLDAALPILVVAVMMILIVGLSLPPYPEQMNNINLTCFSLLYLGIFLAFVIALRALPNGFVFILTLYGTIEIHDGFANMLGRIYGKRAVFGSISPGKTVEGTLSGVLMTLTLIPLMKLWVYQEIPWAHLTGLVLVIVLLTIVGDLVASKFKRMVDIKDSGQVIPYRGGFLDIYDALIFAAPATYLYIWTIFV